MSDDGRHPQPKQKRRPPLDRRKLPPNRAMIDVAVNHGLSGPILTAFQLAWRYHAFWETGLAWDDQPAFLAKVADWLADADGKAPAMTQDLRQAIGKNRPLLARLLDETVALRAYYEGQSDALH